MLDWVRKLWRKREPVYSEIGQRLWEWLQSPSVWSVVDSTTIVHVTGLRLHTFQYRGLRVSVLVNENSLAARDLTDDDHHRLNRTVTTMINQILRDAIAKEDEEARKQIKRILGITS